MVRVESMYVDVVGRKECIGGRSVLVVGRKEAVYSQLSECAREGSMGTMAQKLGCPFDCH